MTYNTWLLWRPANGHAAIFDGYLSELSASDQPHHLLFRFEDLLTALIVLAQAVRAALFWAERVRQRRVADPRLLTRWWFVAWLGLLIFAVSTLLDSFFAMDCSPTLSAACRAAEQSGSLSRVHYLHTYTSVSAETGIVIAMVAACLALGRVRHGGGRLRTMRHLVLGLAVAHLVALTTMMTLLAAGLPGLGYAQAVMVLAASIGFALVGFALAFGRNWARAPDVTRELLAEQKRARW